MIKPEISNLDRLSDLEIRTQRAYAIRQFAWYQACLQCRLAEGKTDAAKSFSDHMLEANGFIDACNRKLGDVL